MTLLHSSEKEDGDEKGGQEQTSMKENRQVAPAKGEGVEKEIGRNETGRQEETDRLNYQTKGQDGRRRKSDRLATDRKERTDIQDTIHKIRTEPQDIMNTSWT